MKSVFWLVANRLAGRCGPTMDPWSLFELRAGGIDAVLNVSEFEPAWDDFAAAQMKVAWIPLPNACPATPDTEQACLESLPDIYAFIHSHLEQDQTVLVHCVMGRDRTGLALAHYLARTEGLSAQSAIARLRQVRPNALAAEGWAEMAERVI